MTKIASSFLLPFSHHASQIAFCSRSATRQCLPQANLQSRRSRGQDTSLALAASHTVGTRARPLFFALLGKKFTRSSAKTFKKEVGQFIANGTGFPVLICWGAGFSPSVSLARSTSLVRGRHSSCVTLQVKMEHKKEVQHGKHSRPPSDEGGGAEGDGGRDFLYLNTPTNPNLAFKF